MRAQQSPGAGVERSCKNVYFRERKPYSGARTLCVPLTSFLNTGDVFISLRLGFPICKVELRLEPPAVVVTHSMG